mgnify:CR=1 FL=1
MLFFVNHTVIRSWNQLVLSNADKVSCSRKQRECFMCHFVCIFCKRMWYPLSATWLMPFVFGCSLRKGKWKISISFSIEDSHISWYCTSCYCCRHLSSCFFYTAAVSSLICFILFILTFILSHFTGVFLLTYHFKIWKQLLPRRFFPAIT